MIEDNRISLITVEDTNAARRDARSLRLRFT